MGMWWLGVYGESVRGGLVPRPRRRTIDEALLEKSGGVHAFRAVKPAPTPAERRLRDIARRDLLLATVAKMDAEEPPAGEPCEHCGRVDTHADGCKFATTRAFLQSLADGLCVLYGDPRVPASEAPRGVLRA